MRDRFGNLRFVVVDEFSMMKADMLYRLDLSLKELKRNNRDLEENQYWGSLSPLDL